MICMVNKPIHQLAVENEASPFNAVKQWHALSVMFQRFENLMFFGCGLDMLFLYICIWYACIYIYIYVYMYICYISGL